MKILLILSHGLYLRNFESLIRCLSDEGHSVVLVFTASRPADEDLLQDLDLLIERADAPVRAGWWWPTVEALRALRDHIHYWQPAFEGSDAVRARIDARVPASARRLARWIDGFGGHARLTGLLDAALGAMPVDAGLIRWVQALEVDLMLATPLVDFDHLQSDLMMAATEAGLPTGDLVASWDNMTTKTRCHVVADRIFVWNEAQRREAITLHGISPDRLAVTGAPLYDQWFTSQPRTSRERFCQMVGGLDPAVPLLLYCGSSPFICPDEIDFFRDWLARLRSHSNPLLRTASVLVRPHPLNDQGWSGMAAERKVQLAIWPIPARMPVGADDRQDYFDSLWHCDAVVGINTSVSLEAAILGKRTFTVREPRYAATQTGTVHFSYLEKGGVTIASDTSREHLDALAAELSGHARSSAARSPAGGANLSAFVSTFLRPCGMSIPAVRHLADGVLALALQAAAPRRRTRWPRLTRMLLAPIAALYIRPQALRRLARRRKEP